jgi:hypothetical protein
MQIPVALPQGSHELSDPVVSWSATFIDSIPPGVQLTASIQSGPSPPLFPNPGPTATTLVIQMDARVAIELYTKLGNLARSMGWLPQTEGEGRS